MAVRRAKMIGMETGNMKVITKSAASILSVKIKFRFVSHLVNRHSSRIFTTSIITKSRRINRKEKPELYN
jgi:hypothetical protein